MTKTSKCVSIGPVAFLKERFIGRMRAPLIRGQTGCLDLADARCGGNARGSTVGARQVGLPGIAAIALAHGLTIMAFAFAYGSVSGMTPPSPKRSANCFGQSGTVVPKKPGMKSSPIGMPGLAIDSPHYRGP
jgi:hypothetical protein